MWVCTALLGHLCDTDGRLKLFNNHYFLTATFDVALTTYYEKPPSQPTYLDTDVSTVVVVVVVGDTFVPENPPVVEIRSLFPRSTDFYILDEGLLSLAFVRAPNE